MGCSIEGIPKYLHYSEQQKLYPHKSFKSYHLAFATGFKERQNPVEFPQSLSEISVCWSKLIRPSDVLNVVRKNAKNPDSRGDSIYYTSIKQLNRLNCERELTGDTFSGKSVLRPYIEHSPFECNYSHADIKIEHTYYESGTLKRDVITKEQWEKKKCPLRRPINKELFKPMMNDYEAKLGTLLNSSFDNMTSKWHVKFLPKNLLITFALWKATIVRNVRSF